jgi:Domain of unknown function (DUF4432)
MIPREKIGHLDQVALVSERPALDVRVLGGIDLRLHPERGFDIGAAWFRGTPLAWIASAGESGADVETWRDAWGGGLVTTCGLDNVGAPSEGIGLHGTYMFLPAEDVRTSRSEEAVECRAIVHDPRGLRVERTIRTSVGNGRLELVDRTVNVARVELEAPVLYHINLGWPLWDVGSRVETNAVDVRARDGDAEPHDWREAPTIVTERPERVWEHVGATRASVTNDRLGLRVGIESDLPRLWQWVDPNPGMYVLGVEPANCSVRGRASDRAEGRLPSLAPGSERTTHLIVTAELTAR